MGEWEELDHSMISKRGTAAAHHSLTGWVKSGQNLHPSECDNHTSDHHNLKSLGWVVRTMLVPALQRLGNELESLKFKGKQDPPAGWLAG